MIIDDKKLNRQLIGVDRWMSTKRGTLHYTMQFGKSYTAILIIKRLIELNLLKDEVLILVPSEIIRRQWNKLLEENNMDFLVMTAQTAINSYKDLPNYKLLIIDEVHKFITPNRISLITNYIKYDYILGLTGSYPSIENSRILDKYCPVVDVITEEEALKNGWISNFREYNFALTFDLELQKKYISYTNPIRDILQKFKNSYRLFKIFKNDYEVLTACCAGKYYQGTYYSPVSIAKSLALRKGWGKSLNLTLGNNKELEDNWNPSIIMQDAKNFNDLVRERNELLINNNIKLEAIKKLYIKFKDKTIISFNESTDFANDIAEEINKLGGRAVTYHSNMPSQPLIDPETNDFIRKKDGSIKMFGKTTLKNNAINGMLTGRFNFISTARALDEGLSIPNINMVICSGGTVNPLQYSQRSARGKTVNIYDKNKVTIIVNLFFDDFVYNGKEYACRDKQKLILRQKENNANPVWVTDIEDIC